jgi:hypothetical protein
MALARPSATPLLGTFDSEHHLFYFVNSLPHEALQKFVRDTRDAAPRTGSNKQSKLALRHCFYITACKLQHFTPRTSAERETQFATNARAPKKPATTATGASLSAPPVAVATPVNSAAQAAVVPNAPAAVVPKPNWHHLTEGKRLCSVYTSDDPAVMTAVMTVADGHSDRESLDSAQKVQHAISKVYNNVDFKPNDIFDGVYPDLAGDPSTPAKYQETGAYVHRDPEFLNAKFNDYRKDFTIVMNMYIASGTGYGGTLSGGNLRSFVHSPMNADVILMMYEMFHRKPNVMQYVKRLVKKAGRTETNLGGGATSFPCDASSNATSGDPGKRKSKQSRKSAGTDIAASGVTVPPAAGHNSRKASASIRRDKRLKTRTSQDAQGASVAAATERLTAVSQRNSNLELLLNANEKGMLSATHGDALKAQLAKLAKEMLDEKEVLDDEELLDDEEASDGAEVLDDSGDDEHSEDDEDNDGMQSDDDGDPRDAAHAVHLDATRREITMTDGDHDAMEADNFWAEVDALATAHGA